MKPVVFIHGWAAKPSVWDALIALLPSRDVINLSLPAYGRAEGDWQTPTKYLADQLPAQCHLVGWSLGGHLAMQLAAESSHISSVCTIATAPQFVADDIWPWAMLQDTFTNFAEGVAANTAATLKRFAGLQTQGEAEPRKVLKELRPHINNTDQAALEASLAWLGRVKQQQLWQSVQVLALHLFSANDALVPVAAAEHCPNSKVLEGFGHAPMLSAPQQLAEELSSFWQQVEAA